MRDFLRTFALNLLFLPPKIPNTGKKCITIVRFDPNQRSFKGKLNFGGARSSGISNEGTSCNHRTDPDLHRKHLHFESKLVITGESLDNSRIFLSSFELSCLFLLTAFDGYFLHGLFDPVNYNKCTKFLIETK